MTDLADLDASDLLGFAAALVGVPSVSGDEQRLADEVERWLARHAPGLQVERVADNLVARTSHGLDRRVVLAGHLDTVPANGNATPRIDGDVLHGLGAADMKGGLAAMLRLAADASRRRGRFDVSFVLYACEEVTEERNGLRHLFAERPDLVAGDLAILLEPTDGWVEAGCQGTLHLQASYRGRRAHSARPWMGSNAIHRAAPVLARLAAFDSPIVQVDGLEFRESLQVVRIEGGVANNVVPDECRVIVNRRYAPTRSMEDAIAETRAMLGDADDIAVMNASSAASPNLMNPLVAEFTGTLDLGVRPKLGWTDVARFAAHGIPALNFGPGDPQLAHTADERVERVAVEGTYGLLGHFLGLRA